jgi:hypothetical protein
MLKNGLLMVVGIGLLSLSAFALADNSSLLPTDDKNNCSALIQQGDVDPPVPTRDIATLQICMASCNDLYQSLSKKGQLADMLKGASFCRRSLNNLYFASVSQNIYEQLNEQTQQENAVKALIASKLKQKAPANNTSNYNNNTNNNTISDNNDVSEPTSSTNTNSANSTATPKGPPEDVNWF